MSSEQMIWVASWDHEDGINMYAATTRDALGRVLAEDIMEYWPEGLTQPDGNWPRVEAYFGWHSDHGDETYTVEQVVLEHDLANDEV